MLSKMLCRVGVHKFKNLPGTYRNPRNKDPRYCFREHEWVGVQKPKPEPSYLRERYRR